MRVRTQQRKKGCEKITTVVEKRKAKRRAQVVEGGRRRNREATRRGGRRAACNGGGPTPSNGVSLDGKPSRAPGRGLRAQRTSAPWRHPGRRGVRGFPFGAPARAPWTSFPCGVGRHVLHARCVVQALAEGAAAAPLLCPASNGWVRHPAWDRREAAVQADPCLRNRASRVGEGRAAGNADPPRRGLGCEWDQNSLGVRSRLDAASIDDLRLKLTIGKRCHLGWQAGVHARLGVHTCLAASTAPWENAGRIGTPCFTTPDLSCRRLTPLEPQIPPLILILSNFSQERVSGCQGVKLLCTV